MSGINYTIIRSKRRSVALEISSKAELIIRAPFRIDDSIIKGIIDEKKSWIERKIEEVKKRQRKVVVKKFVADEEFLFLGKKYKLRIVRDQKEKLKFDNGFFLSEKYILKGKELIIKWYKNEAEKYMADRIKEIANEHGFSYGKVQITNAKKRWGVCNGKNWIRINWRLIMATDTVIKYVIIHELVHTKIKNHSRLFWNEVSRILPDFKKSEKWIKENREQLYF